MSEPTTPADLCRELGIEAQVSSLVDLVHANNSKTLTADVVRFAMTVGARALATYEHRGGPEQRSNAIRRALVGVSD